MHQHWVTLRLSIKIAVLPSADGRTRNRSLASSVLAASIVPLSAQGRNNKAKFRGTPLPLHCTESKIYPDTILRKNSLMRMFSISDVTHYFVQCVDAEHGASSLSVQAPDADRSNWVRNSAIFAASCPVHCRLVGGMESLCDMYCRRTLSCADVCYYRYLSSIFFPSHISHVALAAVCVCGVRSLFSATGAAVVGCTSS